MLTDCSKCWATPCICGHEYHSYEISTLLQIKDAIDLVCYERRDEIKKYQEEMNESN